MTSPSQSHPLTSTATAQLPSADPTTNSTPSKHHSQEADELDMLCRKMNDVRVRTRIGVSEEHIRLCDVSTEQFLEMVRQVQSPQLSHQRAAIIQFRKLLAHEDIHPYLDKIIESGVLPTFCKMLTNEELPELQFESAWVLTNISAGTSSQTAAVVEAASVPLLVHLVANSPHKEIKEQCIWCLGNIAGDSSELRSYVLDQAALEPLLRLISNEMNEFLAAPSYIVETATAFPSSSSTSLGASPKKKSHNYNLSTLRIAIWALSNFCRGIGRCELDWNLIDIALPVLSQVINCCSPPSPHTDDEILMDACWALSRTLRGIHEGVEKIIVDREVCEKFGSLICYDNPEVQIPALRCLINIVSGCDAQTQVVIDAGLLPFLHTLLLNPPNETVRKEACLIISNITAGTVQQVQAVLEHQIIPTLIDILRFADFRTKREACWALGNAMLGREPAQVEQLLGAGLIPPLVDLLHPEYFSTVGYDERVLLKALEAIKNILASGDVAQERRKAVEESAADALLDQFEKMEIYAGKRKDSAYGSSTDLFASTTTSAKYGNPFVKYFVEPLASPAISALSDPASLQEYQQIYGDTTALERLRRLARYCKEAAAESARFVPSREVAELVREMDAHWFVQF